MAEELPGIKIPIEADAHGLKDGVSEAKEALGEFGINVDSITKLLSGPVGLAAAFAIVAEKGMEMAREFDEAGSQLGKTTGQTGAALDGLKDSLAKVVAGGVVQGVDDIGKAIATLNIRLGLTGDELETATRQFSEFADITGQTTAGAVAGVTQLMAQWNIPATDLEVTLDRLTKTMQLTGGSAADITAALVQSGPVFQAAGISINEAMGMLVGFQKAGMNVESANTAMNIALRKFAQEGVTDSKAALTELIARIKDASTASEGSKIAVENFGRSGITMAQAIRSGALDVAGFTSQIEKAEGTLARTGAATESFNDSAGKLGNQVGGLLAEAFKNVLIVAQPLLQLISALISGFESLPAPVKQIVEVSGLLVGAFGTVGAAAKLFGIEITMAFGPVGLAAAAIVALAVGLSYLADTESRENKEREKALDDLKKTAQETKGIIGPVNELTENQKLGADAIASLIKLYPELTGKLKENNTTTKEAAALARDAAVAKATDVYVTALNKLSEAKKNLAQYNYNRSQNQDPIQDGTYATQIEKTTKSIAEYNDQQSKASELIKQLKGSWLEIPPAGKAVTSTMEDISKSIADQLKLLADQERLMRAGLESQETGLNNEKKIYEDIIALLQAKFLASTNPKEAQNIAASILGYQSQIDKIGDLIKSIKLKSTEEDTANKFETELQKDETARLDEVAKLKAKYALESLTDVVARLKLEEAAEVQHAQTSMADAQTIADIKITYSDKIAEATKKASEAAAKDWNKAMADISSITSGYMKNTQSIMTGVGKIIGTVLAKDFKSLATAIGTTMNGLFTSINSMMQNSLQASLAAIDRETLAREVAAGVAQDSAVQTAQKSVDSAQAAYDASQSASDKTTLDQAKAALARTKIEEEATKRKNQLAYQAAHTQWELSIVQAIAGAALAIVQGYAQLGPIGGTVAAVLVGALTGVEIGIIASNEPKASGYATGTSSATAGLHMLAEQGPELVTQPSMGNLMAGSKVYNARQTAALLGGGQSGYNLTINAPTQLDAGAIDRMNRSVAQQMAFRGRLA